MKKYIILLITGLVALTVSNAQIDRTQPPKPGPAPIVNIGDYTTFTLKNGLKVIVVENHKTPVISWQLSLDIDPVLEGDAAGYIDMAGSLMRSGTSNRTKQQIDEEIDFIGASLNTFSTGIFASSLTKHKGKLLELMTDVLFNPLYPQEELDKVVTQSLSGLSASENDANFMVDNLLKSVLYGKEHPYGEVVTKESLKNITREKLVDYYNTYFKPNVAYLIIVGDISKKEAKKLAKKYFKDWEKGDVPEHKYETPQMPPANSVAFAHREGAVQSVLAVSYPVILKPGEPDVIKASVMNSILGGGVFSGRLMQNLREDKAYTYGARSSLSSNKLVGRFSARTEVGNGVTDSAATEILYEMDRMIKEPVDQKSLDLVKNFMSGSFARSLESPRTIANFALNIERYNLPRDYYATYLEKLAAVNVNDVSEMAQKYIKPENAWIIVGGNKDEVAPKLSKFASSNEVLFFDAYARPIEKNEMAIPAGLTAEKVIENYLKAIGGREKLARVNDISIVMNAEMQGMTVEMAITQKSPNKLLISTSMGGNVMQKQVYNGERGVMTAMGQTMELSGKQLDALRMQANMFPEMTYKQMGYDVKLVDTENIDGKVAYKILVTKPDGSTQTDYFDTGNGLKIRSVSSQETQMGSMSIISGMDDYREVKGILFPYVNKQQVGPQNFDLNVVSVEINTDVPDSKFNIE